MELIDSNEFEIIEDIQSNPGLMVLKRKLNEK